MHQALDTFVAEMADGSQIRVAKGDYLPDAHPLVRRDAGAGGSLFRRATFEDDEKRPAKSAKAEPAPPPVAAKPAAAPGKAGKP